MLSPIVLGFALSLAAQDPSTVVRNAERAVEVDSVARAVSRWTVEARRDSRAPEPQLALATIARLTYDYERAARHLAPLLARPASDPWRAHAQLGAAHAEFVRGRFAAAESLYAGALEGARAAEQRDVEAEALIGLAGRRPEAAAMAMLDTAVRLAGDARPDIVAQVHCRRLTLARTAPVAQRLASGDSGTALASRERLYGIEGRCAIARAIFLGERGETTEPLALFLRADSLLARVHDLNGRAMALSRLGFRHIVDGDYGAARRALRESIPFAERSRYDRYLAYARVGLGAVALRVNDYATAGEELGLALAVAERAGDEAVATLAHSYMADLALGTGDFARARAIHEKRLAGASAEGLTPYNEFVVRRNLAQVGMRMRDFRLAERELAAARRLATENDLPNLLEELVEHEARLALLRGNPAAAVALYQEALATLDGAEPSLTYGVRARLAQAYAGIGDLARAERELSAASDDLDEWRASLEDQELRLLAAELCGCADQDLGVPSVIAALAAGGRIESAFALAERRRARELVNRMMQAEVLREQRTEAADLRDRAARQGVRVAVSDVAAVLPAGTALLEYVVGSGDTPTTLFLVVRDGAGHLVRSFALAPADSLAPRVRRLLMMLESGDASPALARSLGAELLDAALGALPPEVTRLVIVPDGVLHRVPFDALRTAAGDWVLERYSVSAVPSAAVALELWRRGTVERQARGRLLALGDPMFGGPTGGRRLLRAGSTVNATEAFVRLPASGREARLVARHAQAGEVRLRGAASESFLKRASLERYDVLHLATHAVVDDHSAARTVLALAPGDGEDGLLSPGDLAGLRLDADLVVLSACRTAGGVVLGGEGVWGLTGPLLQAGARAVVATGWQVGDRAAVRLVEDLYAALARGLPVDEALREAKLAALRGGAPASEWAAFSVVGDGGVVVPLRQPAPGGTRWLAGPVLLLAAMGGGATYWSRRRATTGRARAGDARSS